jgi:hypothetical protein
VLTPVIERLNNSVIGPIKPVLDALQTEIPVIPDILSLELFGLKKYFKQRDIKNL